MCLSDLKLNQVLVFTLSCRHLFPSSALPSFTALLLLPKFLLFFFLHSQVECVLPLKLCFLFSPSVKPFSECAKSMYNPEYPRSIA